MSAPPAPGRQVVPTPSGDAWADVAWPADAQLRGLLVLGHGAGGSVDAPDLLVVRGACLDAGLAVASVTQPYRAAGRRAPAPAPRLDEAWCAVISHLRSQDRLAAVPLLVGGRSSGARVACRTAAAVRARGVIALAFPLHPPGSPEKSRQSELDAVAVPVLVVQGDADPFGMPPPAATRGRRREVLVVPGDHSLRREHGRIAAAARRFALARTRTRT